MALKGKLLPPSVLDPTQTTHASQVTQTTQTSQATHATHTTPAIQENNTFARRVILSVHPAVVFTHIKRLILASFKRAAGVVTAVTSNLTFTTNTVHITIVAQQWTTNEQPLWWKKSPHGPLKKQPEMLPKRPLEFLTKQHGNQNRTHVLPVISLVPPGLVFTNIKCRTVARIKPAFVGTGRTSNRISFGAANITTTATKTRK